jgi:hypothetical protein
LAASDIVVFGNTALTPHRRGKSPTWIKFHATYFYKGSPKDPTPGDAREEFYIRSSDRGCLQVKTSESAGFEWWEIGGTLAPDPTADKKRILIPKRCHFLGRDGYG